MSPGPLPPHERSWRHPSELVGPTLPPPTRSGRMLILSSAAVALVLIGVLALALTPRRAADPTADDRGFWRPGADRSSSVVTVDDGSGFGSTTPDGRPALVVRPDSYVVTPVAAGYALTTRSAIEPDAEGGLRHAQLPSGRATHMALIAEVGPMAVVSIPTADDQPLDVVAVDGGGVGDVGDGDADGDGYYVVSNGSTIPLGDPFDPDQVDVAALARLTPLEGSPVVDEGGQLVGLVTFAGGDAQVLAVSGAGDLAPPRPQTGGTDPAATTVTTAPSAAPSTPAPSTVEPAATDPAAPATPPTAAPDVTAPGAPTDQTPVPSLPSSVTNVSDVSTTTSPTTTPATTAAPVATPGPTTTAAPTAASASLTTTTAPTTSAAAPISTASDTTETATTAAAVSDPDAAAGDEQVLVAEMIAAALAARGA